MVDNGDKMQLIPFDAPCGAKVTDLDLVGSGLFDRPTIRKLELALVKYKVLKIVGQKLNPNQLARIGAEFG